MCALPVSQLFILGIEECIAMGWCPANINILAQETAVFQMIPNTQNDKFPQNACNDFY
jgi:hypothetical protein